MFIEPFCAHTAESCLYSTHTKAANLREQMWQQLRTNQKAALDAKSFLETETVTAIELTVSRSASVISGNREGKRLLISGRRTNGTLKNPNND